MTAWKKLPNRHDINLVEPYDINSARNTKRPVEPIGFTDPGPLKHPTPRRSPTRLLAQTASRNRVAELGPSERLRMVVTSGDEDPKAAGIVSLFQVSARTNHPKRPARCSSRRRRGQGEIG